MAVPRPTNVGQSPQASVTTSCAVAPWPAVVRCTSNWYVCGACRQVHGEAASARLRASDHRRVEDGAEGHLLEHVAERGVVRLDRRVDLAGAGRHDGHADLRTRRTEGGRGVHRRARRCRVVRRVGVIFGEHEVGRIVECSIWVGVTTSVTVALLPEAMSPSGQLTVRDAVTNVQAAPGWRSPRRSRRRSGARRRWSR